MTKSYINLAVIPLVLTISCNGAVQILSSTNKDERKCSQAKISETCDEIEKSDGVDLAIDASFQINKGASYTATKDVTLSLTNSKNVIEYRSDNNSSCEQAEWREYSGDIEFQLADQEGLRTVCMQVKNEHDKSSTVKTATIVFDKTAPELSLTGLPDDPTDDPNVTVTLKGNKGTASYRYSISSDWDCDDPDWSDWSSVSTPISESVTSNSYNSLCIQGRDQAGNSTAAFKHPFSVYATMPPSGSRDLYAFGTAGKVAEAPTGGDILHEIIEGPGETLIGVGAGTLNGRSNAMIQRRLRHGALDPSFDGDATAPNFPGNGLVFFDPFPDTVDSKFTDLKIQEDGKLLATGVWDDGGDRYWIAARFNPDGSLDRTFAGVGYVKLLPVAGNTTEPYAVALSGLEKIALCGQITNNDIGIVVLNNDGSLDTDFDGDPSVDDLVSYPGNGIISIDFDGVGAHVAEDCVYDDSQRLVFIGHKNYAGADTDTKVYVARITASGELDGSFDGDGWAEVNPSANEDHAHSIALQPDGKILLVGSKDVRHTDSEVVILRYTPAGALDTSFNATGQLITNLNAGAGENLTKVAVLPLGGGIIVAGQDNQHLLVAKIATDGTFDASFVGSADDPGDWGAGTTRLDTGGLWEQVLGMTIQSNGQIVLAGHTNIAGSNNLVLLRLWP